MAKGIEERHSRSCRTRNGGRCDCEPTYRVRIRLKGRDPIVRTFASQAEAASWRKDALISVRRARDIEMGGRKRLSTVVDEWLAGARAGAIRTRSGDRYKPSAVRSYDRSLRLRVLPQLGDEPIEDIRRADLQDIVDDLIGAGLAESTIEATVIPLRSIFRRELERDRIKVNPCAGLVVPRNHSRRERFANPAEAAALLTALPDADRAVWATAMYAGLRRGELRALHVDRVDLEANVMRVERGWDDLEGEQETKGRNRRRVPIPLALREHLLSHLMRTGRRGDPDALVFGQTATAPFQPRNLTRRADHAWAEAKLDRITLHECRHTFASLMIDAGVNAKALCDFMGHSSITVTFDRYGHLMPGGEDEAGRMLDNYLTSATG